MTIVTVLVFIIGYAAFSIAIGAIWVAITPRVWKYATTAHKSFYIGLPITWLILSFILLGSI